MAYELTGRIKLIQEPQTFPSGFAVREFVVTVEDGNYPQDIALRCVKERMKLLDDLQPGQDVKVSFDIRGREYNGRYFVNLEAWRIQTLDAPADMPPPPSDDEAPADIEYDDDIPF